MLAKKYKIAITLEDLSISGGTARQALELARELKHRGYDITVYSVYCNPYRCYPELQKELKIKSVIPRCYQNKGDGKHRFSIFGFLYNLVFTYWHAWKISQIIDTDTDIINPHLWLEPAWFFKIKHPKVKVVWFCNEIPTGEKAIRIIQSGKATLGKRFYVKFQVRRYKPLINIVDAITVNDNRNALLLKDLYNRNSIVCYTGTDVEIFKPRNLKHVSKSFNVLLVNILTPPKRVEDAIFALNFLKKDGYDIKMRIIGNDYFAPDYNFYLQSIIKKNNLGKEVVLIKFVDDKTLIHLYSKSDVFIWPAESSTYGLAVIEAMSCGLPVIVSKSTGVAEILNEENGAFIVPPRSPKCIAEKLKTLIINNKQKIKMGKRARKFVVNNLTWSKFTDRIEKVSRSVMRQ